MPFTVSFVDRPKKDNERKRDPDLPEKLKEEAPGILAWLVRGCFQWQQEGLNPPDAVRAATEKYRHEEDQVARFIEERCVIEDGAIARADALFRAYQEWGNENKEKETLGKNKFSEAMMERFQKDRDMNGVFL